MTTEKEMCEIISDLIWEDDEYMRIQISTFEEEGILNKNTGLILKTEDGSEFQITVVKSR